MRWRQLDRVGKIGAVFTLTRIGLTAVEIGEKLMIEPQHIHALARTEGIELNKPAMVKAKAAEPDPENPCGDIWGRSANDKRAAFYARMKRAARERLLEIAREDDEIVKSSGRIPPQSTELTRKQA